MALMAAGWDLVSAPGSGSWASTIDAPPGQVWKILVDTARWPVTSAARGTQAAMGYLDEQLESAGRSLDEWLGDVPETSDAATARTGEVAVAEEPEGVWDRIGQSVGDFHHGLAQEGASGLLDPSGMMDRQQAQRDLSTRFQVVGDDHEGEPRDNQVTQEEYEQIARTFSDIRLGRGDLTLDSRGFDDDSDPDNDQSDRAYADAQKWEQGVMTNIADMMMTEGGRAQIQRMSDNPMIDDDGNIRRDENGEPLGHHSTTIMPHFFSENRSEHTSQYLNTIQQETRGGDSAVYRTGNGERGLGHDTEIHFNPTMMQGVSPDVILAHELQHARNFTQGSARRDEDTENQTMGLPTEGGEPADTFSENDYRQQRNALGLGDRYLPRTAHESMDPNNPGQPFKAQADSDEELVEAWRAHQEVKARAEQQHQE
jgi:hypothetical protein